MRARCVYIPGSFSAHTIKNWKRAPGDEAKGMHVRTILGKINVIVRGGSIEKKRKEGCGIPGFSKWPKKEAQLTFL
jgi:hypothetical protein